MVKYFYPTGTCQLFQQFDTLWVVFSDDFIVVCEGGVLRGVLEILKSGRVQSNCVFFTTEILDDDLLLLLPYVRLPLASYGIDIKVSIGPNTVFGRDAIDQLCFCEWKYRCLRHCLFKVDGGNTVVGL